jgi:hypothetical protein
MRGLAGAKPQPHGLEEKKAVSLLFCISMSFFAHPRPNWLEESFIAVKNLTYSRPT